MEDVSIMNKSDVNPARSVGMSGTRRLCTHAAIALLTQPPHTFGPAPSSSYHTILASLHGVRSVDMLRNTRCDFSSLAYISQGFPVGVDRSNPKDRHTELKLGGLRRTAATKIRAIGQVGGGAEAVGQGYHTEVEDGEEDETAGAEKRRKGNG
ncbi:hypothetical protein I7I51_02850 [Histoplasma capsulatum]|uniref:Uncharacterized protein n=1 Tax=Ajellomyces capsulatus TaxID=5037 RepID=A0A8A1MN91_AJECA|nr:hypothetical protein I7I51_02850 [Histoplasma capsulatum]